jgi:hypothetical protein
LGGADDPAWVLGLGLYGAVETPHDGSYIRPGWNFGFTTSSMSAPLFFELRLHGMTGRQRTRGFTLLTIGARF